MNMTCEKAMSLLSAYIDRELGYDEFRQVELHVADCEACQAECNALKATKEFVGRLKAVELPRDFWPALRERLGASAQAHRQAYTRTRGSRGRGDILRPVSRLFLSPLARALAPALVAVVLVVLPLVWSAHRRPAETQMYSQVDTIEPYFRDYIISEYDRPLSDRTSVGFVVTAQAVTMYAADQLGLTTPVARTGSLRNSVPREAPPALDVEYTSGSHPR